MGKVIDTTDIIDSSMSLNARIPKNMSMNNYYLDAKQKKINREWKYRYNVVDIEEENIFGSEKFDPVEVVIQTVYDINQKTVSSDDWKKLIFKDIQHPVTTGKRYRFSTDYFGPNVKDIDKSIWLTINTNKTAPTQGVLIRKCDSFFTIPSIDGSDIHYEPVALDADFKYINFYSDMSITVPQAEIYAVMQYNQYTKNIKINHRFLIGPANIEDREDNLIFKVKAVRKFQAESTYDLNSIPLVFLALERSSVDPNDDFETRIMSQNSTYKFDKDVNQKDDTTEDIIDDNNIIHDYYIKLISDENLINDRILLNSKCNFSCFVYDGSNKNINVPIDIKLELLSTDKDSYYYDYIREDNNNFSIFNKKAYIKNKLQIMCTAEINDKIISYETFIELGGNT